MTPLITGGCGFIGSHLCDAYTATGDRVMVLDNLSSGSKTNLTHPEHVALTIGDVADRALVKTLIDHAGIVFHLAAIASVAVCAREPAKAKRTNVDGTRAIFDAAIKVKERTGRAIPIIYASSAAVYGDNPNLPLSESTQPSPISAYGEHKLENERIALEAYDKHGIPSVGLRFFNVYGPRQDASSPYSGVISKFVANAKNGEPFTFFGDGEQTRDFIYIADIVRLLITARDHCVGATVYNGCTGISTNLKQLAKAVGDAMGKSLPTIHAEAREGDIRHSRGSASLIRNRLGFTAEVSIATGLRELVKNA